MLVFQYLLFINNKACMIKLSSLISEKFELPPTLQKQLENTGYSALGYILLPHVEKFKKKLFSNKELNEQSYQTLKNLFDSIRTITRSSGGNTKFTIKDVLVPEYFSITTAKKQISKETYTIEKGDDYIHVESSKGRDSIFPSIVINKDYAGWDLNRLNNIWNQWDDSYKEFQKEFDRQLVTIEHITSALNKWKTLDKPKKPKIHPGNQKMTLVYEKDIPDESGKKYDHYFRVLPSKKVDDYDSPDHFAGAPRPYIVQTVYIDQFSPNTYTIQNFMMDVHKFIGTSRHEGRHLIQHYGNLNKNLKGDLYGTSKRTLRHPENPDIRGSDASGIAGPTAKFKEPSDRWNRVLHPYRDVEFKTNLYNYKEDIEEFLNKSLPKEKWKEGFNDLIRYAAGIYNYGGFRQKYPFNYSWEYSVAKRHLEELFKHDRPKFNEFVKELYKLIFNQ